MKEFWNERFAMEEYVYGTEPNDYLTEVLPQLAKGSILFPAEGEGRNAVYAAQLGFDVDAFDYSEAGKRKAEALATAKGVNINYQIFDFDAFDPSARQYDVVALIYAHPPKGKRTAYHQKALATLKPGGTLILEGFSKAQLGNPSGGPKDLDMLYDMNELQEDFRELKDLEIEAFETVLNEGNFHNGTASIIRLIGKK